MKLKAPWVNVHWSPGTAASVVAGVIAFFVFFLLLGLAILGFLVWVIVANVQDIAHVGPNFWNIFWIVLAGLGLLGLVTGNRN